MKRFCQTQLCLPILLLSVLVANRAQALPLAKDIPDFKVRVRIDGVDGKAPADNQKFTFSLTTNPQPVEFDGSQWSAWSQATRDGIADAVAPGSYPNSSNKLWQVKTDCAVNPTPAVTPFPDLTLQVETAIVGGEVNSMNAELFGADLGLLLWRGDDNQIHIDTLTGHGRRVYDKAMRQAILPLNKRPHKIIFGDRYIGSDDDVLSWKEGIQRLSGLGFNAMYPVPANLTKMVRDAGISRTWGAVYSPPGEVFNFDPLRFVEYDQFVQEQIAGALSSGWKKEEIAFWVTADEPGWYYPDTYTTLNADPNAMEAFHDYLRARGMTLTDVGKANWDGVKLIGRKQYTDLPSRRLFYWSNRFLPWASSRFFSEVARSYEKNIRPNVPIMVNMNNFQGLFYQPGPIGNNDATTDPNAAMGQHDWLEFGRERGSTCITTEDWFGDDVAYQWSYYASRQRAASDLGGVGIGALVVPVASGQRPMGMAQKLLALVGNGAKNIQFFVYGPEYNFPGNCYSENVAVYKPLSTGIGIVAKAEDLLYPGQPRQPHVGILTPQSSQLWDLENESVAHGLIDGTNIQMYDSRMAYMDETRWLYLALEHAAVPVQFIDEEGLTEARMGQLRVIYVTAPDIPREAVAGLLQWVREGGTLVTVAGTGVADRYHQPMSTLLDASGISTTQNVRPPVFDFSKVTPNGWIVEGTHKLLVFGEREKLAMHGAHVLASFNDGSPGVTVNVVGKGRIIHFACYPGISYRKSATGMTDGLASGFSTALRNMILQPVHAASVDLPVGVDKPLIEAPALYSKEGVAVTLLNWSGQHQDVNVWVASDHPVRAVESVQLGTMSFRSEKGRILVHVPLSDVDVLMLRY